MEPRGCNRWQPVADETDADVTKSSKTVAVGCDRLRPGPHGKEGVSGSSPEEGSAKAPHVGAFPFTPTCSSSNVRWVWSLGWSLQGSGARSKLPVFGYVYLERGGRRACGVQVASERLRVLTVTKVVDRHCSALVSEALRDRVADAAAGAGDECDLAAELT